MKLKVAKDILMEMLLHMQSAMPFCLLLAWEI
jgi:hypothetical protein